mgnify:CR=1 FL=1
MIVWLLILSIVIIAQSFFIIRLIIKNKYITKDLKIIFAVQKIRGYNLNEVRALALEFQNEDKTLFRKSIEDLYKEEKKAFETQLTISMRGESLEGIKVISDKVYPIK